MQNPLIDIPEQTNETFIPFDKIKDEHFEPAFEIAFEKAKKNLESIITNPEPATFENTIEALEKVSHTLDFITTLLLTLKEADATPARETLSEILIPKLANYNNDIALNEELFIRVKEVFDSKPALAAEQQRLLGEMYHSFVRGGALLSSVQKEQKRAIDNELAILSEQFSKNLLEATNAFQMIVTEEKDLSGLPDRVIQAAKEEATVRSVEGWVFTLKQPSVGPVMQFADSSILREKISYASRARAMSGAHDNREIVKRIMKLRHERAQLLGYENHAAYVLADRMAKDIPTLKRFFDELYKYSRPAAEKDIKQLKEFKSRTTGNSTFNAWDSSYYTQKLQQELFNVNDEDFRPFLEVGRVIEGVFEHVRRLYGLIFIENISAPTYHSDVRTYEVKDGTGRFYGYLYLDLFARASKRNGAWAEVIIPQHQRNGKDTRPICLICCDFPGPTNSMPSLLSLYEAQTLFHEFGHALHSLLCECRYAYLSGPDVSWDFVELPSQLFESWVKEKEGLKLFARHYQTNESIPDSLLEKMSNLENFMAGSGEFSKLSSSVLDFAWHSGDPSGINDIENFEEKVLSEYRFFPHRPGTSLSTNFKHIFSGYDVGYYSYQWADVLAADAFEYFKEKGLFSREIAEKFREHVLSKGNTEEPMELYKRFRGREPDPKALLRSKGLL